MSASPAPVQSPRAPHWHEVALFGVVAVALAAVVAIVLARSGLFDHSNGATATHGSGVPGTEARVLPPFDGVELAGSTNVRILAGAGQSVVVHADANLLRRVTTSVDSGRLVIGERPGSFTTKSPMYVEVATPSVSSLTLSGSGIVVARRVDSPALTVDLTGSGVIQAAGRATRLTVTLDGSGDARLGELVARRVNAVMSGTGRIAVTATGALDASMPGTGAIVYGGNPPVVRTSVTGTGVIVRR